MSVGKRAHNFNAGPAVLPWEVLEEASQGIQDFAGLGMSILEISHRAKEFEGVLNTAVADLKEILGIPAGYSVLFLQGGASHQFAMIPYNFLLPDTSGNYVVTGSWAKKALKEAKVIGKTNVSATSENDAFNHIPSSIDISEDAAYLHITTNNTIFGTQYKVFPDTNEVPLVADMSSDFLSRSFDVNKFSLIYAGAQKNAGPAGVTILILKDEMLKKQNQNLNTIWNYTTHVNGNSLFNTPSVYGIYVTGLVFKWIKKIGGLAEVEKRNEAKAKLVYDVIDQYPDFFKGHAKKNSRSLMNITFRLPSEELEKMFLEKAKELKLVGLKGHREVGGLRASTYNALPMESVQVLTDLMKDFVKKQG
ncbi:MAG: 3-phosphoserine/phosphohydroxythreonine transaminase [Candidatus Delongbacteria bacterium]|nr:3-phosphoserine/phosphohydroxythreonine transaminase [Candidatus Delongbacteria bacterium]